MKFLDNKLLWYSKFFEKNRYQEYQKIYCHRLFRVLRLFNKILKKKLEKKNYRIINKSNKQL